MAAPEGNKFWEARSSHGANPKFTNPEDLWDACVEYFEWNERNPQYETKPFNTAKDGIQLKDVPIMRPLTLHKLCLFLPISRCTWNEWRSKRKDLSEVIARVDDIIFSHQFDGAAGNLLNPNIIARSLGLKDHTTNEHTGEDGDPIEVAVSATDALIAGIISAGAAGTLQEPDKD